MTDHQAKLKLFQYLEMGDNTTGQPTWTEIVDHTIGYIETLSEQIKYLINRVLEEMEDPRPYE